MGLRVRTRRRGRRDQRQGPRQDGARPPGRPVKQRVFVDGLNIVKRHQRPTPGTNQPGGVIEKPGPIHISNVALVDPKDGKPTRTRVEDRDGKRVRVGVRSGEVI